MEFQRRRVGQKSSDAIFGKFIEYKEEEDFAGMDAARKFLQMGYTRAMRYAKHEGGNKSRPRGKPDPVKERCEIHFHEKWRSAAEDAECSRQKEKHRGRNERG